MNWTSRRRRFRTLLEGDGCVFPASVFDPFSARAAEELGFELAMLAGSIASMTVLGRPDLALISLTEFAEQAYRICRAAELPLLVDADHGYGNALNVMRTVEELEAAGVAALTIEDTLLPRGFGRARAELIPVEEGIGKMRAAVAARQDPDTAIVARTSAVSVSGLEDAIARLAAYEQTGVDAMFISGVRDAAQLDALSASLALPIILGGTGDLTDIAYLRARRVRIALKGHQPFLAAVKAVFETLQGLRQGASTESLPATASPDLVARLAKRGDFDEWSEAFLSPARQSRE